MHALSWESGSLTSTAGLRGFHEIHQLGLAAIHTSRLYINFNSFIKLENRMSSPKYAVLVGKCQEDRNLPRSPPPRHRQNTLQ